MIAVDGNTVDTSDAPRFRCSVCYRPLGCCPPAGWLCPDDHEGRAVRMSLHDTIELVDDHALSELWHTSRQCGISNRHARRTWVVTTYVKQHPDHGGVTAVYKAMEAFGIGELTLTPAQAKLVDRRRRERGWP